MERSLIVEYEADIIAIVKRLQGGQAGVETLATAQQLAGWPAGVRGYGHVKQSSVEFTRAQTPGLRAALQR